MNRPRVLVGGVGYRWQSDASFGVVAADALARLSWPEGTTVMDLGYGALYVAEDLRQAEPRWDRLVLIGSEQRDGEAGALRHYRWTPRPLDPEDVQERVREAGAGVLHLDHLLIIAQQLDALPEEVEVFELEPVQVSPGEPLSEVGAARLAEAIAQVRAAVEAPRWKEA